MADAKEKIKKTNIVRADLSMLIQEEFDFNRAFALGFIDDLFEEISLGLIQEGSVKISSFGSFLVKSKGKRLGRNPKTKEEVDILPRRVLSFRPSQYLRHILCEKTPEDG